VVDPDGHRFEIFRYRVRHPEHRLAFAAIVLPLAAGFVIDATGN
jgi:hypothetical protein